MKEKLKIEFDQVHNLLQEFNSVAYAPNELNSKIFQSVLTGVFAKCIEFNFYIVNKKKTGSFFLLSSLRSITEELIAFKYIILKYSGDKNELISTYAHKNCYDNIIAQQNFFKQIGSQQPIMNEALIPEMIKEASNDLKKIWEREGLNKKRDFPSVAQMATDGKLIKLYDYLYSASSSHVHFNPHIILRTGWSEDLNERPQVHKFSTNNFDQYYEDFTIYYGCFLFVEMIKAFKKDLNLTKEFLNRYKAIKSILEKEKRIPELVTFEEFNIKRGMFFTLSGIGLEHMKK
tara:strand:- start:113 stop:979 length:867 start_codon:yes stop_codon:yes gene_type:complete